MKIIILCCLGFCGTVLRYYLTKIDYGKLMSSKINFNLGLLICNVLGCTLVLIFTDLPETLTVGFFGAFTSMSSLVTQSFSYTIITIIILSILTFIL